MMTVLPKAATLAKLQKPAAVKATKIAHLTPLAIETRVALPTAEAAAHLNRSAQTLRLWAMRDNGPVRCLRVNGRLAWPVAGIKALLEVA